MTADQTRHCNAEAIIEDLTQGYNNFWHLGIDFLQTRDNDIRERAARRRPETRIRDVAQTPR